MQNYIKETNYPKQAMELYVQPFYYIQTLSREGIYSFFHDIDESKTNLLKPKSFPAPYCFDMFGLSASIMGENMDSNDIEILNGSILTFFVNNKNYLKLPFKVVNFENVSYQTLEPIFKTFTDLVRQDETQGIDKIEQSICNDQKAQICKGWIFPMAIEHVPLHISYKDEFSVEIELKENLSQKTKIIALLHGIFFRPVI